MGVFVCLPAGSGKSVCYGCLPYAFNELEANTFSDFSRNAAQSVIVLLTCPLTARIENQAKRVHYHGFESRFCRHSTRRYFCRAMDDSEYSLGCLHESGVDDDNGGRPLYQQAKAL